MLITIGPDAGVVRLNMTLEVLEEVAGPLAGGRPPGANAFASVLSITAQTISLVPAAMLAASRAGLSHRSAGLG